MNIISYMWDFVLDFQTMISRLHYSNLIAITFVISFIMGFMFFVVVDELEDQFDIMRRVRK